MVVVGMPTLRARGLAFPVITLAFGLVTSDFLLNTGYSPFEQWLPDGSIARTRLLGVIPLETDAEFFFLSVVVLVLWVIAGSGVCARAGPGGCSSVFVTTSAAAEAYSIRARNALMLAFAVSGFLAGVAGALFVLQQQLLVDQTFTPRGRACRSSRWSWSAGWGRSRGRCSAPRSCTACSTSSLRSTRSSRPGRACCSS